MGSQGPDEGRWAGVWVGFHFVRLTPQTWREWKFWACFICRM